MSNEYNLPPMQYTYLELKHNIASVVHSTTRMFYWASRDDVSNSSRFTEEKAEMLYDILSQGNYNTREMVMAYYTAKTGPMPKYLLENLKTWADKVNNNIDLFDGIYFDGVKAEMKDIERCFELITSNEWVKQ